MKYCIPREALTDHIVVLAKTGAGKSYAVKGDVVEPLLDARDRVCIVDPTDAWHGLRSSATGKSAGYPVVIFGGEHGDLPLAAGHGEALAEIVGTSSTPVIIVTKLLSVRDRTRFFTDFADGIMRKNRGPLTLVIDEAHRFAPKGAKMSPQSGEMLAAANELSSAGRSAGLRVILITQRPAKLHNDSLSQCETLVAMRMISPADRTAVMEWVKENASAELAKEIVTSLAKLKDGEGWVWSPQLDYLQRVKFPRIRTFDSSKAPEHGEAGRGQVLAPIDKDAIAERLKAIGADVVANDPGTLRRQVADLQRQLAARPKEPPPIDSSKLAEAQQNGRHIGFNAGWEAALDAAGNDLDRLVKDEPRRRAQKIGYMGADLPAVTTQRQAAAFQKLHITRPVAAALDDIANTLSRPLDESPTVRKILDAIHGAYPVSLSFDAAARRAGISSRSSAYRKYRKAIAQSSELEEGDGRYRSLPQYAKADTTGNSVQQWAAKLPESYGKMLLAISERGPLTKEEVARHAYVSPKSSGLGAGLRELRHLKLVDYIDERYTLAEGL